jgi:ferrochelatase
LAHLWEELSRLNLSKQFKWSVIDRWNDHPTFIRAVTRRVELGLEQIPPERRDRAVIVFTAHSLPMKVVAKADPYPQEVGHTVQLVMKQLQDNRSAAAAAAVGTAGAGGGKKVTNPYVLSWQSKVGYLPWLVPSTGELFKGPSACFARSLACSLARVLARLLVCSQRAVCSQGWPSA